MKKTITILFIFSTIIFYSCSREEVKEENIIDKKTEKVKEIPKKKKVGEEDIDISKFNN